MGKVASVKFLETNENVDKSYGKDINLHSEVYINLKDHIKVDSEVLI